MALTHLTINSEVNHGKCTASRSKELQGFGWVKGPLGPLARRTARQKGVGSNEFRGERAPRASMRDKGTLGHPFGRHGREFP
ncbi:hypothetical protein CRG98_020283 [Punica granatum]|uniref:Uncharacterized protein n=1 Tax=Punica granatum TaxID=22663 RepID=A0A2I0JSP8_PUNGR|nr:hypothetical protein CRG98_020283 [Punica granatum]